MSEIGKLHLEPTDMVGIKVYQWCLADEDGKSLGLLNEPESLADEILRRWNAFEEGGLVGDLVNVCEDSLTPLTLFRNSKKTEEAIRIIQKRIDAIKAALAKAQSKTSVSPVGKGK